MDKADFLYNNVGQIAAAIRMNVGEPGEGTSDKAKPSAVAKRAREDVLALYDAIAQDCNM